MFLFIRRTNNLSYCFELLTNDNLFANLTETTQNLKKQEHAIFHDWHSAQKKAKQCVQYL